MSVFVPAYYYAQQGADPSARFPGQSYEGWGRTEVPFEPSRTAIIVMHLWQVPQERYLREHVEYLSRTDAIIEKKFPDFLQAARRSGIRIIHVAAGFEKVLPTFPGYRRMMEKYPPVEYPAITPSEELLRLRDRHWRLVGANTQEKYDEIESCYSRYDFAIKPRDDEDVVFASSQLFSLCRDNGIEHLIYTGFAVNACLTMSPCGMMDMTHCGLMCSIVGDMTTAVENKETCAEQRNREYGLWQFAVQSGFVLLSDDLKDTLLK